MATEAVPAPAPTAGTSPAKFSRYRSVRRAQAQQQEQQQTPPVPDMPPVPPVEPATVSRSMSRYHRRPTTSHSPAQKPPPLPSVPPPLAIAPAATHNARSRAQSSPQYASHGPNGAHPRLPNTSKTRSETTPLVSKSAREPSQAARDEAKQLLQKEAERQRRMHEQLKAEKRAKLEAKVEAAEAERVRRERLRIEEEEEAARRKAKREADEAEEAARRKARREADEAEEAVRVRREKEEQERGKRLHKAESATRVQKREDEARQAKLEEAARKAQSSAPNSPSKHGGGLRLFARRRKDDAPTSPESPANSGRPRQSSGDNNRDLNTIRPGGGGAVLGIDAPKSAINAGDRRVLVVCNKQEILLPVTPTTTPLDLIKSASNCLTEQINVRTAVILESFQKVGLKRPLRNYEHVRDVMNSWDDDKQNDLLIVDSVENDIDQRELLASQVPDSKPEGMGCYIHYSSKPGKWSKRYCVLQADGQLTMGRSENSKDQENICHLSDFDIYSPTDRKLSKVKPPKKICYAVKSQQKSNIYVDESRFVHFFCTNDRDTASKFYKTLHGWRSWYLVHVMGEGQKKAKSPESKITGGLSSSRNVSGSAEQGSGSHMRNASVGSHYQLGSFMPLLDLDQFTKEQKEEPRPLARADSKSMHARKMSTRSKGPPPLSYNLGTLTQDTPQSSNRQNSLSQGSGSESGNDTFAADGLLGHKYSERQRALQEKEQKQSLAFTEGPSLINNTNWSAQNDGGLNRRGSVQSQHRRTSSDIQRSKSSRVRPKPLVDLTPQYREPPQHARKGKGFIPEVNAGPLIENATSIEEAIKIPSSTDWRARPNHGSRGTGGGYEHTHALKGGGEGLAAYTVNKHSVVPEDDSAAFTGGGLLARTGFSQGSIPVGHGIMDGSKAKGPMLDLREEPMFASGSLLASVPNKRQSVDLG